MWFLSFWEKILRRELVYKFWTNWVVFNYRPDFLKNQKTWQNLEIDLFVPKYNIWIEFQWWQHFTDKDQIFRDELKLKLCTKNKIKLYRVTLKWLLPFLEKKLNLKENKNRYELVKKEILWYLEKTQKKFKKDTSLKKSTPKQRSIKSIKKEVKKILKK